MAKQIRKMYLNMNGADRLIVCDPEETLAELLRRIGLTSVKIGCGTAMCGSCTVLMEDLKNDCFTLVTEETLIYI